MRAAARIRRGTLTSQRGQIQGPLYQQQYPSASWLLLYSIPMPPMRPSALFSDHSIPGLAETRNSVYLSYLRMTYRALCHRCFYKSKGRGLNEWEGLYVGGYNNIHTSIPSSIDITMIRSIRHVLHIKKLCTV